MWKSEYVDERAVHVYPLDDLIHHELTYLCSCYPTVEVVEEEPLVRMTNLLVIHSALDGRE